MASSKYVGTAPRALDFFSNWIVLTTSADAGARNLCRFLGEISPKRNFER